LSRLNNQLSYQSSRQTNCQVR